MTPTQNSLKLNYHRGAIRAQLICRPDASGVRIWIRDPPDARQPKTGTLELLLQPRGSDCQPCGLHQSLYQVCFAMSFVPSQRAASAYVPLPFRFSADLLRNCYLRVKLDTINSGTKTIH